MIISSYAHDHLKVCPRSAQGTLTISSSYAHYEPKVRPRSAQDKLMISARYGHDQLKVYSESGICVVFALSAFATNVSVCILRSV